MGLWDFLADKTEQNTEDFMEKTKAPVSSSSSSSLLGDIYSQQERAGKTAIEEAYNPVEDFQPVGLARKALGKLGLAAAGAMGAGGIVRFEKGLRTPVNEALHRLEPEVADWLKRTPQVAHIGHYSPGGEGGGTVAEWLNKTHPGYEAAGRNTNAFAGGDVRGGMGAIVPEAFYSPGRNKSEAAAIAEEFGHMFERMSGARPNVTGVPGAQPVSGGNRYHMYSESSKPVEVFADLVSRYPDTEITNPIAYKKFLDEIPKLTSPAIVEEAPRAAFFDKYYKSGRGKLPSDFRSNQELEAAQKELKTQEYWMDREVNKNRPSYSTEPSMNRGPKPEGELADLLSSLGKPSPKVNPSDIPDATKSTDMPSEVFDYIMRKNNIKHEDIPTVKEQKRRALNNFAEWWQSTATSDDDRRMYSKMIQSTAEKASVPQAKTPMRVQQMAPQDKRHADELLRLRNVAGLRKK